MARSVWDHHPFGRRGDYLILYMDSRASRNREAFVSREQWRDVVGFEGVYKVSSLGRVRRVRSGKWRILKGSVNRTGYRYVTLVNRPNSKSVQVSHLVADAFIGKRPDGYQVNHIDGNKLNNAVNNLEYCTRQQNIRHAVEHLHRGLGKLTSDDAARLRDMYATGEFDRKTLAQAFGVSDSTVGKILNGTSHKYINDGRGTLTYTRGFKLLRKDVDEIRATYAQGGISIAALALRYGVHYMTMRRIIRREIWR